MAKKKSGEDMYGKKIVGPKGHVRHGKTTHKRKKSSDITLEKNNDKKIKGYIGPRDSNKAHPTGMQAYSGARRNKLKKALDAREDKVRPSKKKVPKTIPTIKARSAPTKRRPTMKEQLKDSSVAIDYDQLDKMRGGGKVKGYKKGGPLKAESFENMKEVEHGKMRKTIRNIKGSPKEIAKDKKAKKVVTAPRPKRPKSIRKTAAKAPSTKMDKERTKRIMYNKRRKIGDELMAVARRQKPNKSRLTDEMIAAGGRFITEKDKLDAKRKRIKNLERIKGYKKGGSITYRMSGGQVVGHGYD